MFKLLGLALVCVAILSSAQTGSSKYQPGTITAVARHQNAPGGAWRRCCRYDVSVKVGNTLYKVLYAHLTAQTMWNILRDSIYWF